MTTKEKYPKIKDILLVNSYTCQKCGSEFRSGLDRKIQKGIKPLCPKCSVIWRRGTL